MTGYACRPIPLRQRPRSGQINNLTERFVAFATDCSIPETSGEKQDLQWHHCSIPG